MMRTPLNKTRKAETKENPYKNRTIQEVENIVKHINDDYPEKRVKFIEGIEKAKQAGEAAKVRKLTASAPEDYAAAVEEEKTALNHETFYREKIEALESTITPTISEDLYYALVENVKSFVYQSAEDYRKTVLDLMDNILKSRQKLLVDIRRADAVLGELDQKAKVLQAKYTKDVIRREPPEDPEKDGWMLIPVIRQDTEEWKNHITRFSNYETINYLSTLSDSEMKSQVLKAAWYAGTRALSDCFGNEHPYEGY